MKCSLIVCTYNWPEALSLVLASISKQKIMPDEIIIADDGSGKSTLNIVNSFNNKFSVPLVHSWQEDKGCRISHSRNRAIAKAKFEYIIVIDGDTVIHPNFIEDHKKFAKKGVYLQGSRALLQNQYTQNLLNDNYFKKPFFLSKDVKNRFNLVRFPLLAFFISFFKSKNIKRVRGCNFSLYKSDILQVNGFNEAMKSWGREDSEFVQRLFNSGVLKRQLKFSGIQYHLFHKERVQNSQESANANNSFLEDAIGSNLVWCNSGIDRHL